MWRRNFPGIDNGVTHHLGFLAMSHGGATLVLPPSVLVMANGVLEWAAAEAGSFRVGESAALILLRTLACPPTSPMRQTFVEAAVLGSSPSGRDLAVGSGPSSRRTRGQRPATCPGAARSTARALEVSDARHRARPARTRRAC